MPKGEVQVLGESQVKIKAPDGAESGGVLDNAYRHYMLDPEQKDGVIEKYTASFQETVAGIKAPLDHSGIVPILKDREWVGEVSRNMAARSKEKPLTSVHEPYNDDLTIVYAEDTPRHRQYMTLERLAALKLELKDLRPIACANLSRLLPDPDIQPGNGLYRIKAGGAYDACLLLLDDFWNSARIDSSSV